MELLAATNSPTWIVGDLTVHLERTVDSDSRKFVETLETVRESTHALEDGWML